MINKIFNTVKVKKMLKIAKLSTKLGFPEVYTGLSINILHSGNKLSVQRGSVEVSRVRAP